MNSAIGGSTNAPIHLDGDRPPCRVDLPLKEWETVGHRVPLLVNLQPAGEYLGEDYYRAGGVPAVVAQLMSAGLIREGTLTVNGRTLADNCRGAAILDERVIRPFDRPLMADAGFLVLSGNLFDAAIMKTSVIGEEFRAPLPLQPGRSRGLRRADCRVRRTGGLPPPHRRSGAGHHARHACCSCAAPGRSAIRAPPKS